MIMNKTKSELIEVIGVNINKIVNNRHKIIEMKEHLSKYNITSGRLENVFSNPEILEEADMREVILLTEQFFLKTGVLILDPSEWFTKSEMKESRQFLHTTDSHDDIVLPAILENVSMAKDGVYSTTIDIKTIAQWRKAQVLNYNYDIQRQATRTVRKNETIKRPTVYRKNVNEIKELMLKRQLVVTTIALNAAEGSSDVGEELVYDDKSKTLTINEGTRLDILDGFHRTLASVEALSENPDLDFKFIVIISNYSTRQAQQYQAQLAKATPISKTRIQMLEAGRHADRVVQLLELDSELKDRIAPSHMVSLSVGELVSYNVLSDAIDREFDLKARVDARNVSNYLSEFFEYLIGENQDEFLDTTKKKESLMSYNKIFSGYIALAAKMKKEGIKPQMVNSVLERVDFSRENPIWKEIGVIDELSRVSAKVNEKKIAEYFRKLDVKCVQLN